ncbi:hypothetical protein HCN51_57085 [Nonomuraea sp. FMUSA5-5]|uniref:Uncharacterized protein n=1 Tax=Nonomuraea composti TaxID=2720023 RepID=A0ABX1BQY0_9ACTN|nr:hypothetical protein [Nonomuraea sp. FMUSA5-5]NJP98840.1 hypothetical protein [Nonomuraea sp. FMUSA5-5]
MAAGVIGGLAVLAVLAVASVLLLASGAPSGGRDRLAVAEQPSSSSPAETDSGGQAGQEEATPTPSPAMKPRIHQGIDDKVVKVKETEEVLLATLTHNGRWTFTKQ